jgi:hypothetical protein
MNSFLNGVAISPSSRAELMGTRHRQNRLYPEKSWSPSSRKVLCLLNYLDREETHTAHPADRFSSLVRESQQVQSN